MAVGFQLDGASTDSACTRCGASKIYKHNKGQKTVFDLKFTSNGIKRWVVRYTFSQYFCQICKTTFKSPKRNWTRSKFGSEIKAYALYQNIELRLPQEAVDRSMKKLFGLPCLDRLASDLIELSTRHNFLHWLALGAIYRGWARSASGDTAEGIPWIEHGIKDYRANGAMLSLPGLLGRKAEALHRADRTSEALEAINEAEALAERFGQRYWCAELHRLRGLFLTAMGADEMQIEASFCKAIRIAREQKSISLEKRAEGTYAEYRRQKAGALGGQGFRLPLW